MKEEEEEEEAVISCGNLSELQRVLGSGSRVACRDVLVRENSTKLLILTNIVSWLLVHCTSVGETPYLRKISSSWSSWQSLESLMSL